MRFEWDEQKNASNLRKHGVRFVTAQQVFYDPLSRTAPNRTAFGEER